MTDTMVELRDVIKQFDQQTVVHQLSLSTHRGEFITLLGPSGCGKTTTLRLIAGFEKPTSGEIYLDGERVDKRAPYERNLNTVFQNYALFPHLSIYENVAFGLRVKKVAKAEIDGKVKQALKLVQLEEFGNRKPEQLSGGQKQRIAIARALVNNPKVLLLDEPLGALDLKLRKQMQVELKHLQRQLGITFVFVTHDQEEALTMSDRIAVMNQGRIEQMGSPGDIYDRPASKFVAEFIGETNFLPGIVQQITADGVQIEYQGLQVAAPKIAGIGVNDPITLAIRPERTWLTLQPTAEAGTIQLPVRLMERIYTGSHTRTIVKLPDGKELASLEGTGKQVTAQPGEELYICWKSVHAVVLKG